MENLDSLLTFYLKSAATPHCLNILKDIEEGQWARLINRKVDPAAYRTASAYFIDAQAQAFFSKNASLSHPDLDPAKAAEEAWWQAEHRCALTNITFERLLNGPMSADDFLLSEFLQGVKRRISSWLGPLPKTLNSKFGPGVTLCCNRQLATVADKMTVSPTTTSDAWYLAKHCLIDTAWFRSLLEEGVLTYDRGSLSGATIVRSSRWACVPKNAKTHRSIEIGPNINVALQLDIGKLMKKRFAAKNWDLLHAAPLHKERAREASLTGTDATIDLKQASDSISKKLVEFLLPKDWFDLLDQLRTRMISIGGKSVHLEKFSGMGNGFTFELESVIFMSIAQEVCSTLNLPSLGGVDVLVFGDDIIVPTAASDMLIKVLNACGFQTNVDKTFVDGAFRESCGGDFFNGVAVRPYFLKENPSEPQDWIKFVNGIRHVVDNNHVLSWVSDILVELRLRALQCVPTAIRACRGPAELGDIVIHDEKTNWITKTRDCIRYVRVYKPVTRSIGQRRGGSVVEWDNFPHSVKLATILLGQGVSRREYDALKHYVLVDVGIIPRNPLRSYKHGWVPFS